ncbi:MAG: hypothetical protein WDO12_09495 [Pseudomonadota bacterium]
MHDNHRFGQTYLALVALNWQALECTESLLREPGEFACSTALEERLQWLRLELLQLRESACRCAQAQRLSTAQQEQVHRLVRTLLEWLDFDAAMAVDIVRLRLWAAQNWLLDEAGRCGYRDADPHLSRRRG